MNPATQAAMNQMTKYSFVGNPTKVTKQINDFVNETAADELMVVSHIFDHEARLHSYSLLKQIQ